MDFGGRYLFLASRSDVWNALNDAEVLKAAIPGCQKLDWKDGSTLDLEIRVNLGVLKPVFSGDLTLSQVVPAERYTLSGKGRGGLAGMAEGAADIVLSDADAGTILVFDAQGGASGQLMKLGRSLIGSSAQRIIDGFFERFGTAMGAKIVPLPRLGAPGA